jgi:outer membrane protein
MNAGRPQWLGYNRAFGTIVPQTLEDASEMIGTSRAFAPALALMLAVPGAARAQEATTPPPERPTLELSLDESVKRALENNVDIAVERYNPELSEETIRLYRGSYDPLLISTVSQNSRSSPATNAFAGATEVVNKTTTYNFGADQLLKTGGNVRVDFSNNRGSTNSVFSSFNPIYNASLNANLSQPFLRNFKIDNNRMQLKVARKNREISDVQFQQTVTNTVAGVKDLYYDLLYAIDNLEAQRKSLSLAQKLLDENQIKVKVGTMAPLDVVAAQSEVASREEGVIVAEAAVAEAEDAIKSAIFPKNDPSVWALRIVPTDRPTAEPVLVDVEDATRKALEHRTDVVAARKNLENADVNVQYASNQKLPDLNLIAAYGSSGIGGTVIEREGFGGPIIRTTVGGYNDALSSVFGRDFPTWTFGVNFSYPIFNRQGQAASARAKISRDQTVASLRRLEMQVASEVRSAGRAVETNYKRVESTRAARVLQERRLDAEQKKFAAGMSTNFLVTQAQRDLALAEVLELRAIADYRKSLVNFDRVQLAGGGVSFATTAASRGTIGGAIINTGAGTGTGGTGNGTGTNPSQNP